MIDETHAQTHDALAQQRQLPAARDKATGQGIDESSDDRGGDRR